jgi:hypothetical protein
MATIKKRKPVLNNMYGHRIAMYTGIQRVKAVGKITWLDLSGKEGYSETFYDREKFLKVLREEYECNPSGIIVKVYDPQTKKGKDDLTNDCFGCIHEEE